MDGVLLNWVNMSNELSQPGMRPKALPNPLLSEWVLCIQLKLSSQHSFACSVRETRIDASTRQGRNLLRFSSFCGKTPKCLDRSPIASSAAAICFRQHSQRVLQP